MARSKWQKGLTIAVAVALAVAACSDDRSQAEWMNSWSTLAGQIPPLETIEEVDAATRAGLCEDTLAHLREAGAVLTFAEDADLASAAMEYVEFVEAVFFECPIGSGDHAGFEAGYHQMDRLRAEVEALLDFEG